MSKPRADKQSDVPDALIKELLTESELRMVKQRYSIVNLLNRGLSIRDIAARLKVGTDTVVRVSRIRKLSRAAGMSAEVEKAKPLKWVFGESSNEE